MNPVAPRLATGVRWNLFPEIFNFPRRSTGVRGVIARRNRSCVMGIALSALLIGWVLVLPLDFAQEEDIQRFRQVLDRGSWLNLGCKLLVPPLG